VARSGQWADSLSAWLARWQQAAWSWAGRHASAARKLGTLTGRACVVGARVCMHLRVKGLGRPGLQQLRHVADEQHKDVQRRAGNLGQRPHKRGKALQRPGWCSRRV